MGLDLYAGTLTRYYTHNWKTTAQQWAEENGYGFQRITPQENSPDGEMSPDEIRECMEDWRDQILAAVSRSEESGASWPENNEKPYFTDKPDWDAFGAMLLTAACYTYGEPVPETVPKNWDFSDHPLIKRLADDQDKIWSLFKGAEWWLPLRDGYLFRGPLPTGDQRMIATTGGLRRELEKINSLAWQAEENTILEWSRTEGYPAEGEMGPDGKLKRRNVPDPVRYDTQSLAKFAFSVFYRALKFAEENQVPVILDY